MHGSNQQIQWNAGQEKRKDTREECMAQVLNRTDPDASVHVIRVHRMLLATAVLFLLGSAEGFAIQMHKQGKFPLELRQHFLNQISYQSWSWSATLRDCLGCTTRYRNGHDASLDARSISSLALLASTSTSEAAQIARHNNTNTYGMISAVEGIGSRRAPAHDLGILRPNKIEEWTNLSAVHWPNPAFAFLENDGDSRSAFACEAESLLRAMEHLHAILDLYNTSNLDTILSSSSQNGTATATVRPSTRISLSIVRTTAWPVVERVVQKLIDWAGRELDPTDGRVELNQPRTTSRHLDNEKSVFLEAGDCLQVLLWRLGFGWKLFPSKNLRDSILNKILPLLMRLQLESDPSSPPLSTSTTTSTLSPTSTASVKSESNIRQPNANRLTKPNQVIGKSMHDLHKWVEWSELQGISQSPNFAHEQLEDRNNENAVPIMASNEDLSALIHCYQMILRRAVQSGVTMSFAMWDMYRLLHDRTRNATHLPRSVYTDLLVLCARSPVGSGASVKQQVRWSTDRRVKVLRDMVQSSSLFMGPKQHLQMSLQMQGDMKTEAFDGVKNHALLPTRSEFQRTLFVVAREGRMEDGTWLVDMLKHYYTIPDSYSGAYISNGRANIDTRVLQTSSHANNQNIPLTEMYQYVLQMADDARRLDSSALAIADLFIAFKLLLRKLSQARVPGAGMQALDVFERMEETMQIIQAQDHDATQHLEPVRFDAESVFYVVVAYLNEAKVADHMSKTSSLLRHVTDANRFVRRCVMTYGLHNKVDNLADQVRTKHSRRDQWRIIDRLLEAYVTVCQTTNPKEIEICQHAIQDLIQFFLIQHRERRITSEKPDSFHLGHVLRFWNKHRLANINRVASSLSSSLSAARLQQAAQTSYEYFTLFESLYRRGITDAPPDLYNVRQLLGTLAQSHQPGYGARSEVLLMRVLSSILVVPQDKAVDPYAVGHMFWCVIKCHCNDYFLPSDARTSDLAREEEGGVGTLSSILSAIAVLAWMEQLQESDPSLVVLTGAPYSTILGALACGCAASTKHANGSRSGCSDLAHALIERVEQQYYGRGNHRARLDDTLYRDALQCCQHDPSVDPAVSQRRIQFYQDRIQMLRESTLLAA